MTVESSNTNIAWLEILEVSRHLNIYICFPQRRVSMQQLVVSVLTTFIPRKLLIICTFLHCDLPLLLHLSGRFIALEPATALNSVMTTANVTWSKSNSSQIPWRFLRVPKEGHSTVFLMSSFTQTVNCFRCYCLEFCFLDDELPQHFHWLRTTNAMNPLLIMH